VLSSFCLLTDHTKGYSPVAWNYDFLVINCKGQSSTISVCCQTRLETCETVCVFLRKKEPPSSGDLVQ
jgi:hypothetical protein